MDEFANATANDRRDVFNEVAVRLGGVDFTIAEKDFWVCWTLAILFELGGGHPEMVFKGGTALSKAFQLIQRFSEDIDIVTSVDFFINRGASDPDEDISRSELERRIERLDIACASYITEELFPTLTETVGRRLQHNDWALTIDPEDRYRHTLLFRYPWSDPSRAHDYIRGRVKIELGWRSATEPVEPRLVMPYAASFYPQLFSSPSVRCLVLSAGRTFWEKVTALHAESFKEETSRFFSRHYSDVAALSQTDTGRNALQDFGMLQAVRDYKQRYYASARARYDLAVPGTLRLIPPAQKLRALAADYRAMRTMFFTVPPDFSDVVEQLRRIEAAING